MNLEQTRRLPYNLEQAKYDLDPSKMMEVAADLSKYIGFAVREVKEKNPDVLSPSVGLWGDGRTLILHGEKRTSDDLVQSCHLAELVLSEDGSKLTLTTQEHFDVTVNPYGIHLIGARYKRFYKNERRKTKINCKKRRKSLHS